MDHKSKSRDDSKGFSRIQGQLPLATAGRTWDGCPASQDSRDISRPHHPEEGEAASRPDPNVWSIPGRVHGDPLALQQRPSNRWRLVNREGTRIQTLPLTRIMNR